ncbi:SHOCT domain-containing protein [Flavobacteriaceae bacterium]|nr:SHOCT domain-containing protein [Flavobacteriaceae bacterium]
MKKFLLLLIILISINSYSQKKGKAFILPMGNGVYQSNIVGGSAWSTLSKLKNKVYIKAQDFAEKKNADLEVINFNTISAGPGKFPEASLTFRIVYESKEIFDTNDPNNITINTTGNYLDKNRQTIINKPQQKEIKDNKEEAMLEIKRLKELLDLGVITKEEFDEKATVLKKIILDN